MEAKETPRGFSEMQQAHRRDLELKLSEIKRLENMHEELFSEVRPLIQRLAESDHEALSEITGISQQLESSRDEERTRLQRLFFDAAETFQQQKVQIANELSAKEGESIDR